MINTKDKVKEFIQRCKELGLNATTQRIIIYKSILNDHTHPSPEEIYNKIKDENPTISLATVYKNLETLSEYGFIKKVTPLHTKVRYEPNTNLHHHMVCVKCGKIYDLEYDELNHIHLPEKILGKKILLDYSVQFNIICEECQLKEQNKN
jgi:Fur family peroxide stress response transcriptional regulator